LQIALTELHLILPLTVIHDLSTRSIGFKVLMGHGASIDTTTPAGKLVFGIFAALAEFERDLISERNQSRPCIAPCARTQRRCALQDDGGKSAPRDGRHGTKGNQSDEFNAANWLLPGKRSTGTSRQMGRCARMG
jgi:Resolvase, N terminal domain